MEILLLGGAAFASLLTLTFELSLLWFIFIKPIMWVWNFFVKHKRRKKISNNSDLEVISSKSYKTINESKPKENKRENLIKSINTSPWGLYLLNKKWSNSKYTIPAIWQEKNFVSCEEVALRKYTGNVKTLVKVAAVTRSNDGDLFFSNIKLLDPSGFINIECKLLDEPEENSLKDTEAYYEVVLHIQDEYIAPVSFLKI